MQRRGTLDEFPSITQKIRLVCKFCGHRHTYDVGTIYVWVPEGEAVRADRCYGFSKYFRCCSCDAAGPWEVADYFKLIGLTLRARMNRDDERIVSATPTLFDDTIIQSPAMGEEHLLRLVEREPGNAFLHTRVGNLLRGCRRNKQAAAWYGKALALDAGDLKPASFVSRSTC